MPFNWVTTGPWFCLQCSAASRTFLKFSPSSQTRARAYLSSVSIHRAATLISTTWNRAEACGHPPPYLPVSLSLHKPSPPSAPLCTGPRGSLTNELMKTRQVPKVKQKGWRMKSGRHRDRRKRGSECDKEGRPWWTKWLINLNYLLHSFCAAHTSVRFVEFMKNCIFKFRPFLVMRVCVESVECDKAGGEVFG